MNMLKKDRGSIVLEAAIIMPFFLAFVIAMISFVQIAITDMALQSSVNETTKQVSAHLYPIYLLSQTEAGDKLSSMVSRVNDAKSQMSSIENLVDDYTALIPDAMINILDLQESISDQAEQQVDIIIKKAILPIFQFYGNNKFLNQEGINLVHVSLPQINQKNQAYFGITASYRFKLLIPFMHREIKIQKVAYERVWIGS